MRARMEHGFGHDFSGVRVHINAMAARSAAEVKAKAYTVGQHIVFGENAMHGSAFDERILAHELTHTLQQRGRSTSASALGALNDAAEREADMLSDRAMRGPEETPLEVHTDAPGTLRRIPQINDDTPRHPAALGSGISSLPTTTYVPPRGSNPGACLSQLCAAAGRRPAPANDADAIHRANIWEQDALACVQTGAAASNASHQSAILANEQGEIRAEADAIRAALPALGHGQRRYLDFLDIIRHTCVHKAQEVRIEFHYNVVFDNPPGASRAWGYGAADWPSVEGALAALPQSATWANPRLITFVRAGCHPQDLNSAGQCVGHSTSGGTGHVGGETDPGTGRITIYDAGVSSRPYSRSTNLRLPATQQTLRHEVGHIIDTQIPAAERNRFFRYILPWHDYPWTWITTPASPYPTWQAERERLAATLGMDDGAELDHWLERLQPGTSVVVGGISYMRDAVGGGGASRYLTAINASRLPTGREFEYARSGQGEYIVELYALAVSRPNFLYGAIPEEQSEWLKRVVFHTPATARAWTLELAIANTIPPELMKGLLHTYTWKQAGPVVDEILRRQSLPGSVRRV